MSVHKAGICFGVPHSTLEYKVKERTISNDNFLQNKLSFNGSNFFNECLNGQLEKFWPNNYMEQSIINQTPTNLNNFLSQDLLKKV